MNISGYLEDGNSDKLYVGSLSLIKEYRIENATEPIYNYIGVNSAHPLTALLHPDDVACFEEAAKALHEGTQHIIVRLMSHNGNYRSMYFIMNLNGRVDDGFESITIEIQDIVSIHYKFQKIHGYVAKYRDLMSLSPNIYMEYDSEKDELQFYEYSINRAVLLFKEKLSDVIERIGNDNRLTDKQRAEFDVFTEKLQSLSERAEMLIDGRIFGICNNYMKIRSKVFTTNQNKKLVIAVVSRLDFAEMDSEKYYMSSYALDMATGVYNKRAISELANDVIAQCKDRCYVVMVDVDDFKLINDGYGHMAGDRVMEKVASIINSVATNRGYVGRFGGDEFLLVLDRVADDDEVIMMLKTIRKNMAWECKEIVPGMTITASIGIARYPEHGKDFQMLFNAADKCVYIAKEKGKNRYIRYKPEIHGTIGQEDDAHANVGLSHDVLNRYRNVFDLIMVCSKFGVERIRECMENIRNIFGIDGIRIYDLTNSECKFTAGEYKNFKVGDHIGFMPELVEHFDGNGLFIANKILTIMETCPQTYAQMEQDSVAGVLLVRGNHYLVEFDVFGRLRKWSDTDKGMMMMLGKTLDVSVARDAYGNV